MNNYQPHESSEDEALATLFSNMATLMGPIQTYPGKLGNQMHANNAAAHYLT